MQKLNSLQIRKAAILGTTGNVLLHFKGFDDNIVAIKNVNSLKIGLTPAEAALLDFDPSILVGAKMTVVDSVNANQETIKGEIVHFKAGDEYTATEQNTEVINGNAKIGDILKCKQNGIRINGGMRLELSSENSARISNQVANVVFTNMIANRSVASNSGSTSKVSNEVPKEEVDVFSNENIGE